ncbi:hypothetical protein AVEN_228111-1 [Araneus ventricosus]|uniref:Uncharacterized protein n=1 Tax=Araneus ventricosus TaxID=182803 RepID=A0A4Y2HRV9_ARAVE|nr:hypothetical protein AVEN_228111-1 [Araneus ventricosus]
MYSLIPVIGKDLASCFSCRQLLRGKDPIPIPTRKRKKKGVSCFGRTATPDDSCTVVFPSGQARQGKTTKGNENKGQETPRNVLEGPNGIESESVIS